MRLITPVVAVALLGWASASDAAPRVRGGVSLIGQGGFGGTTLTYGPGVAVDLGIALDAPWTIVARASGAGAIIFNLFRAGVGFERALDARWSLALGAAMGLFVSFAFDAPGALAVLVPGRLDYALGSHDGPGDRRSGWLLSFELAPGFTLVQSCGFRATSCPSPPSLAIVGSVGIGYAWR